MALTFSRRQFDFKLGTIPFLLDIVWKQRYQRTFYL
jgi:hypothetical protein